MRSRYAAYALWLPDYLLRTWHPATRPASLERDPGLKWLALAVRAHVRQGEDAAEVSFVARYRRAGCGGRMHERSTFVREGGAWFYVRAVAGAE